MNISHHIWLALLWIIFGLMHTIFASDNMKRFMQVVMQRSFKYYRLAYSILSVIMISYILFLNFTVSTIFLWKPPAFEEFISASTGITGLCVMSLCVRKYFFDLSGI